MTHGDDKSGQVRGDDRRNDDDDDDDDDDGEKIVCRENAGDA